MKKLINIVRLTAITVSVITAAVSCKNYLDIDDPNALSPGKFPTKIEHVDLLVNSVYGAQHHWCFMGNYWAGYVMYCIDHTIDLQFHTDQGWIDILAGEVKIGNNKVTDPYTALSMGVYYANSVMEQIDVYRKTAPESEKEKLDNYYAECLFFRAYYRWHMLTLYGEPDMEGVGIAIINKVPKSLEEMYVAREKTGECYKAIIADLEDAEKLITQTDNHRVSVWSVKAFLAKAHFFAGNKESAKTYLEACINESGKSLEPFERYRMMFNGYDEYEFNSESFYEMGNKADPTGGNAYGPANTGSTLSLYYPPFCIAPDGTRTAMSYGNQYMHDRNIARFGYTDPTPLSVKNGVLLSKDGEKGEKEYYLSEEYLAKQKEYREKLGTPEYDYAKWADPRLFVCALQPFIDEVQMTIGGVNAHRKVAQVEFGKWWEMSPTTGNDPETFYGWPVRKYNFLDGHLADATRNIAGYNIYFIRLPDIYLMYAELLKDSQPDVALEYVNKVHRRAYGFPADKASPVDYKSLADRTKAPEGDHLTNNPLLYERWAELFGEMRWWEDVRRLRIGQKEADFYKTVSGPGAAKTNIVWKDRNYAMPIPTSELESNMNPGMVQTPGY